MATNMACPDCRKGGMLVLRESFEARGRWVWYRCRSYQCPGELKHFERG